MKKYILLALSLMAANMAVMAQDPIEPIFTVECTTAEGNDSTFEVYAVDANSFHFIGGEGMVYNPITDENLSEANQDLFIWLENLDATGVIVKLGFSSEIDSVKGYCLSKSPNATVSEMTLNGVRDRNNRLSSYEWGWKNIMGATFELQTALDEDVSYTLLYTYSPFYVSLKGLEPATTYYIRPYTLLNGYIMYGGEKSFTTPQDDVAQ